jgi:large subunit ribosomal protein L25
MSYEVVATKRELQGKGASRRLRRAARVPGVVYGGEQDAVAIEMDHNALYHQLKHEAFHASLLDLNLDGKKEQVLLRDIQMHPFRQIVLHVDFQRVAKGEKIHMKVPLHFSNADIAPGVKLSGGVVSHIFTELDVACLPKDLPEFIEVDLSNLAAGHSIHLSELQLPKGVEVVTKGGEDLAVVSITVPRGAVSAEAEAGAAEAPEAKKE